MPLQNNGMRQRTASGIQRNLPCREKLAKGRKNILKISAIIYIITMFALGKTMVQGIDHGKKGCKTGGGRYRTLLDSKKNPPEDFSAWVREHEAVQTVLASGGQICDLQRYVSRN